MDYSVSKNVEWLQEKKVLCSNLVGRMGGGGRVIEEVERGGRLKYVLKDRIALAQGTFHLAFHPSIKGWLL